MATKVIEEVMAVILSGTRDCGEWFRAVLTRLLALGDLGPVTPEELRAPVLPQPFLGVHPDATSEVQLGVMSEPSIFRSACPECRQPRLSRDLMDRTAAPTAEFVCVNAECAEFGLHRLRSELDAAAS
jgi:hypothetical protein